MRELAALPNHRCASWPGCASLALALSLLLSLTPRAFAQTSGVSVNAPTPASSSAAGDDTSLDLQGLSGLVAGGQPKLEVADPIYDFGTVLSSVLVKHVFHLRNAGTGTLIIGRVQTSCGCTAAQPSRTSVGPGEASDLAVTFDTRFDKGPATRTITVLTNDPKNPQTVLTMKGDVKVEVAATPAQVAFGNLKHGIEQSRQVLINDLITNKPLRLGAISNANANIKAIEVPRADGQAGAAVNVTLLKGMPVGSFDDTIKIATSRAPIEITVFGTIQGDITVNPANVSFGIVPTHQAAVRLVRLVNGGDRSVKLLGVKSSNRSVAAVIEPIKPGKEYKVTLQLRPNTPDGALRGVLQIQTDDPEQQTVSIPYYGLVGAFKG